MKQYRAVQVEPENDECIDLVNIEDEDDRMMADPDSFIIGEVYTEDQIEMHDCDYVDEQGVGNAPFAFLVGSITIPTNYTIKKHDE